MKFLIYRIFIYKECLLNSSTLILGVPSSFISYLPQAKLLNAVRIHKNVGFGDLSLVLTLYSTPLTDNFYKIKLFMIINTFSIINVVYSSESIL